ncbi:phosphodiesterase YaeI [Puniceicoccaceae bacterium K14]|nr:phosphodiesterase YaeI [Puniceicoccaceae bacterium K14]
MKLSRRTFLTSLSVVPAAALASVCHVRFREPTWYEITEKNLKIRNLDKPLRILHLSDLHASPSVSLSDIENAIDKSLELNADIAFLTGDYITNDLREPVEYGRILKKLSDQMPTFACIGNHDGGKWAESHHGYKDFSEVAGLLSASGINLLFNQKIDTTVRGSEITIVGLGDIWSHDCKPKLVLEEEREENNPIFVLSHNPDSKSELKKYDWDLMCCGHTHGGQLVIPILGLRPFLPVRDKSFPEGILSLENKYIHITRGIGNLHGLRFNCRPEISILNVS